MNIVRCGVRMAHINGYALLMYFDIFTQNKNPLKERQIIGYMFFFAWLGDSRNTVISPLKAGIDQN